MAARLSSLTVGIKGPFPGVRASPAGRAGYPLRGEEFSPGSGPCRVWGGVVEGPGMGQRLGPGTRRGWTPSPVRAARRIAQMNAERRAREAERVALFWGLVEEQGLQLEQLTTRVRRALVSQAMEIQRWGDELARAQTTSVPVSEPAVVVKAPRSAVRSPSWHGMEG